MPQLSAFLPYLSPLQTASSLPVVWGGHCQKKKKNKQTSECVLTCCNCNLQDGELPHQHDTEAAVIQNRNYRTEGTCGQQNQVQHGEHSSQNAQHLMNHSLLPFTAPINRILTYHHNENN